MALEYIKICPVCKADSLKHYLNVKDYSVSQEEFVLQRCPDCNMIITNPRPNVESIERYYASDNYISHANRSTSLFDKIYFVARNLTLNWKYHIIKELAPNPGKLLDYGCGTGQFLSFMKTKKWNVSGIEPNDKARQKANELLNNTILKEPDRIINHSFEVITLWHVLEHIHDINETLQKLKSQLISNGYLIIAVPNPNSYDCKFYKNVWAAYDVPRHLWHITRETMSTLLKINGFNLIETRPMKLDSYYVSLLSEGYKKPKQLKLITGLKALIIGFLSNLYAIKSKEYSSIIYIAQQNETK